MYLKLAVVSYFHLNCPFFTHVEPLASQWHLMCCTGNHISFNCKLTVSQALKIGDNNVIESKGESVVSFSDCEWCISVENCGMLEEVEPMSNFNDCPADVGRNVILTSGCIIGAFCQVNTCEVIPENTVIYGSGCMRRVQTERPQVQTHDIICMAFSTFFCFFSSSNFLYYLSFLQPQTLQLDFLMKILPNYHHLKKTIKPGHHAS